MEFGKEYIKTFDTEAQYLAFKASSGYNEPNVSYIVQDNLVHYNPYVHDYSKDYLTFISSSDNNVIGWKAVQQSSNSPIRTISYSTDKTNWTSVASTTAGVTLATLKSGDKLYLKGTEDSYCRSYQGKSWSQFTSSGQFTAEGNIMSLIGGDNFSGLTSFTSSNENAFYSLFKNCTSLIDISNLILPATTLVNNCYAYMFYGCTSLTTAPELPATTLASSCYSNMFYGCKALTTAPALPATTLANYCYSQMFQGCTSLTTAPELPAPTLTTSCYTYMFYGCTALTTAPELPATTLASNCYSQMFQGCTSLTTAPKLPATTLADYCYGSMFSNTNVLPDCSNIDFTSESVVASGGLKGLFSGTKVTDNDLMNILPKNENNKYCLPVTTLATSCYYGMFRGCTSLTTAPTLPATTLTNSCYQSMFYGCSKLNSITCLATNISASSCTDVWVSGVASSGTFTKAASMSSWTRGTSGIPSNWTVVNAS